MSGTDDAAEREALLGKLTLREKVRLLTGATTWRTRAEPALGLREMVLSDGPAGVRGQSWDERDPALLLPSASALGALWDEGMVERLGGLLAAEARRKGVDVVLAPTLNLHRTPLGGRHFECFSEDPWLTGRTGAALVRGIQAHGVAATAKHYVANDSETDRLTVDVRVSERVLREVYLAPFEAAVEAGVRVVMAGYNGVDGATMTASPLLAEPLKGEWGFEGVVVSDWGAVRNGEESARAALDLAMPGPESAWGEALERAVEEGRVPREVVDEKVRRLLALAAVCGALGEPGVAPGAPSAAERAPEREREPQPERERELWPEPEPLPQPSGVSVAPVSVSDSRAQTSLVPAAADPRRHPQPELPCVPVMSSSDPQPQPEPHPQPPGGPATRESRSEARTQAPCGPPMHDVPAAERRAGPPRVPAAAKPAPERAGREEAHALLREAVAASTVLLCNRGVLPLDPARLRTVAVIGQHAVRPRTQGGGSAGVFPERVVTPLDGIRDALGDGVRVVHVPGPSTGAPAAPLAPELCTDPVTGEPGVRLRVLDPEGRELFTEHRLGGRQLEPPLPPGAHTVEIAALLLPRTSGPWTLGVGGFGRLSVAVDQRVLLQGEFDKQTDDPAVVHVNPPVHDATVHLTAGRVVSVVARRELAPGTGRATVVTAAPPHPEDGPALAEAVRAARDADAAIVVVGTTEHGESEGCDRTDLGLGGRQDELVHAVTAAAPNTVVVVNSGGPVELPWRARAGAVLLTWFPGQEGGAALADVLFGRAEPGGRLPTTWPAALADAPVTRTRPENGHLDYGEGLHIGYRAWARHDREPAYWFGHGLGFTTWAYDGLNVPDDIVAGESFTVRVTVRNTGPRRGREVVQVYLAGPPGPPDRPERWLAGYAAVTAEPGERETVDVRIPARALRHWAEDAHAWRTRPGPYRVLAGSSAGALPLTATASVRAAR
ncbi:glycoside hydrolase family 3 C-terminal domain-containing protein [Streptomyces sp. NPDC059445]|uniref:glycoside hydrolase family 3 C-terminal domain-containing protein n=1 Tax=Streptomyces sp. NPDC059445 TaxID=3346832 RepID=UPI00369EBB53